MSQGISTSILRFNRVTLRFEEEAPVLDTISFELERGETCVILGAAGSGKTVLLKTAIGLLRPDEGSITLFNQEVTGLEEHALMEFRGRVGILFQEGGLFDSLTIEENVAYPLVNQKIFDLKPQDVRRRVQEALRFVELEHTLEKFPSELSGGMRRRVGIARANVTEPPLVLYDSPTAGLDPITANTIIALILKERDVKSTTTAMVTHRYQDGHLMANYRYNPETERLEAATANGDDAPRTKFLVLQQGRLVFEGTQRELEASIDPYVAKFVKRLEE